MTFRFGIRTRKKAASNRIDVIRNDPTYYNNRAMANLQLLQVPFLCLCSAIINIGGHLQTASRLLFNQFQNESFMWQVLKWPKQMV